MDVPGQGTDRRFAYSGCLLQSGQLGAGYSMSLQKVTGVQVNRPYYATYCGNDLIFKSKVANHYLPFVRFNNSPSVILVHLACFRENRKSVGSL